METLKPSEVRRLHEFIEDSRVAKFAVRKTASKRANPNVELGTTIVGQVYLVGHDDKFALSVQGPSLSESLRTSRILKILSETKDSIEVETMGGVYLVVKALI